MNLLKNINVTVIHRGDTGLAATDVDSTQTVDMSGYDGVMLLTSIVETTAGASTTGVYLKPRHSSVASGTGLTALGSTAKAGSVTISTSDWGKALIVDIFRPTKRYIGASVDKDGTGTSLVGPVYAIQYAGSKGPVSQDSDEVYDANQCISPTT